MAILVDRNSPIDNPEFCDLINSEKHKVLMEMPDGRIIDLANPFEWKEKNDNGN